MGSRFGIVGLGTMGRNLALNIESRGVPVAVWNREIDWTEAFVRDHAGRRFSATRTLEEFVGALERPRRIMMMIPAGDPVDSMCSALGPLLAPGDVLIDGGNSWFEDTRRREADLRTEGIHFLGCGVSGGEDGAREGPSLMPGGSVEAWRAVSGVFEAIAAKTEAGPCVTHVGPDGAGHFVKMVHNGIEYADMQLIAEAWDLLRRAGGLSTAEAGDVFGAWNDGPLESYLVELTARVSRVRDPDTGHPLVDMVLDKAGQKGTGKWTAQVALTLGIPVPTIAAAIDARFMSSLKDARVAAADAYAGAPGLPRLPRSGGRRELIEGAATALYAARVCAYAQGLALIRAASDAFGWSVDLSEIARIWKAGCIIRARLLDPIREAFAVEPRLTNLLVAPAFVTVLATAQPAWRDVVRAAAGHGIPAPAHAASLAYFDGFRTARLPQNLTQAQRDAFGAHTYERVDRPGAFHSEW